MSLGLFNKTSNIGAPEGLWYGLLKNQIEKLEANKEKYEAEAVKRQATVETIIEALHGYSWEDAEQLLKAAEYEMKQRFFVVINKLVDSDGIKL